MVLLKVIRKNPKPKSINSGVHHSRLLSFLSFMWLRKKVLLLIDIIFKGFEYVLKGILNDVYRNRYFLAYLDAPMKIKI